MSNENLLSIIVANYNNEKYILDCLDSILDQSYKNIEVVVADDCSTDNSPEIIHHYKAKHPDVVRAIFSEKNQGVARTRHEAILQASGEYITTLDSDDYYFNDQKLEKEMDLIKLHKRKYGKDIVAFSNVILIDTDKNAIGPQWASDLIVEGNILTGIMGRSCMIPRDFVIKKNAYFEVGGYDDCFPIYEDWDLKIRLANEYEFYYTNVNGTAYRRHGKGLSSYPIGEHIRWLRAIFSKNIKIIVARGNDEIANSFNQYIRKLADT